MDTLDINGVEYRLGSAGGGNQLRQPYLKDIIKSQKAKVLRILNIFIFMVSTLEIIQN